MNDDFDDNDNADFAEESRKKDEFVNNHPLFKQANEILDIVKTLMDTREEDNVFGEMLSGPMMESALVIVPKLGAALKSESYLVSMQNAAIIRQNAAFLRVSNHNLEYSEAFDMKYVEMFREEMEEFLRLFKLWAKEIHKMRNGEEVDEWGLFTEE